MMPFGKNSIAFVTKNENYNIDNIYLREDDFLEFINSLNVEDKCLSWREYERIFPRPLLDERINQKIVKFIEERIKIPIKAIRTKLGIAQEPFASLLSEFENEYEQEYETSIYMEIRKPGTGVFHVDLLTRK